MNRLLPIALLLFASCQNESPTTTSKNGTPAFKTGEIVILKVSSENGQILSTDCKGKDPCKYHVRYMDAQNTLSEGDFNEFELKPTHPNVTVSPSVLSPHE